jgi:hypothetical protein
MYFKRSSRHFLDSVRKSALGGSGHGSQDMWWKQSIAMKRITLQVGLTSSCHMNMAVTNRS